MRTRRIRCGLRAGVLVAAALFTGAASSQSAESGETDGFQLTPSVAWTHGDHRLALSGEARYRYEAWKARVPDYDGIAGLRARVGLTYAWRDRIRVYAQGQTAAVLGMSSDASGAAGLYRSNSNGGNESNVAAVKLRQAYIEARLASEFYARVGRQGINL